MDERTVRDIELDKVLDGVRRYALSPEGREAIQPSLFTSDISEIEKREEAERQRMTKSASSRDSRGLLPDLTQQPDEDDDGANAAAEEEARNEALAHDEAVKFVKSMGVSWINYPEVVPALPPA